MKILIRYVVAFVSPLLLSGISVSLAASDSSTLPTVTAHITLHVRNQISDLTAALGLSVAQQQQISTILISKYTQELACRRDNSLTPLARDTDHKAAVASARAKILALLNADQQSKFNSSYLAQFK
jgi:hypothetical protein